MKKLKTEYLETLGTFLDYKNEKNQLKIQYLEILEIFLNKKKKKIIKNH